MNLRHLSFLLLMSLLMSCSAKRYLPEGDLYFAGHKLEYDAAAEKVPKPLQIEIQDELKPAEVSKILGSRPNVWLHFAAGNTEKEKGFKHWLKYKIGDEPVYLNDVRLNRNVNYIEGFLRSEGFLRAEVTYRIDSSKYEAAVVYVIRQGTPYRISEVEKCAAQLPICTPIDSLLQSGPLKAGVLFSKSALQRERTRIGNHFRSDGYYFFSPKLLKFQADSTIGNNLIKVRTSITSPLPPGATEIFTVETVEADFAMGADTIRTYRGNVTILVDSLNPYVKPEKIAPFITLKPGQPYSLEQQRITIRQLNRLDIFSYVNLNYRTDTTDGKNLLFADLIATPLKRQSISTEINLSTTSNNFTGPGVKLEYTNRNIFRGGEKLRLSGVGRYETQLSGDRKGLSSFEIDIQASLLLPRATGFFLMKNSNGNVPRARYMAQYRLYQQADFYAQSAVGLSFGYEWLGGEEHFHDLKLIAFDYLRLLQTSQDLEELLEENPLLRESFENQVILGPSYQYSYAPGWKTGKSVKWFFRGAIDFAGNILYYGSRAMEIEPDSTGQYTVGSVPFSQFARIQIDPRVTFKLGNHSEFILRQNVGIGIPYLNSNTLPFSRQFFVGGAQSMRGFQPRGLGPGTYVNPDQEFDSYFDQTGDILIEWNAEYRFGMQGYMQGALFTDIGNVWLANPNPERPGGEFDFSTFANQLAVCVGAGLRIDLSAILIRFDLATPVRKPYLPDGEKWVVDEMNLSKDWRRQNLILNIAIGYPF